MMQKLPPRKDRGRLRRTFAALTIDTTPLRTSRDYGLLFTGQFVSGLGSSISYVVLAWQMFQLTKSSFAVGMLGLAEFVPVFFMAFVGGALADYVNRRRLILLTEAILTFNAGILIVNSILPHPQIWVLYLVTGVSGALMGLQRPAREALAPQIVTPEQMPAIAALGSLRFNFGMIVGSALGGLIAARFGAVTAYALDFATFLVSLVTLWMMRTVPPPAGAVFPGLRSIVEGLRYARRRQELLGTYLIDINAMFFGMPMALFPAIAEHYGGASVGLFYAMPSVGALIATLTSGWTGRVHKHGVAITIAAAFWGVAIICFGLVEHLWLALFFLALAGSADMVSGIFRMTVWNQTIPEHLRGRLAGIEMLSYLTGPHLGDTEAGIVASLFGLRASIVSGGVLCVVGSGLLALALPAFIRYDGREGTARKRLEEAERATLMA